MAYEDVNKAPRHSHLKAPKSTPPKFCSDKCRAGKPRYPATSPLFSDSPSTVSSLKSPNTSTTVDPATWSLEARIEALFVDLLDGANDDPNKSINHGIKGDRRRIVMCQEVESSVFGGVQEPSSEEVTSGRRQKKKRGLPEGTESNEPTAFSGSDLDEYALEDEVGGVPIYLDLPKKTEKRSNNSNVENENFQLTEADLLRRKAGQEKADQRELVRQAGRRGVVFGFWHSKLTPDQRRQGATAGISTAGEEEEVAKRKVEIVQRGKVVEGSFAKGEWGVRWVD